mmetsp:Transcript_14529/g.14635  ORF Transcript_14529/g.14635 Transcript_14529/m.14635 type:complete len:210 (+) Transcript_14529:125-754(+)
MLKSLILAVLFSIISNHSNALYFLLKTDDETSSQKCFTVEQPKNTPIVFEYKLMDEGFSVILSIYYGSFPKEDLLIVSKSLTAHSGHVDFVADNDGGYCICATPQGREGTLRFSLSIKYGYDAEHYERLKKEQKFEALNLEIHKLNDMMTMITSEADFEKHKEVHYHKTTEKMNNAVVWWPLLQISILVLTGIFQVQHLKSFFKSTQLI